ncbi:hypothetical protein HDV00_012033, partial [Rhizophlyctis rosea]
MLAPLIFKFRSSLSITFTTYSPTDKFSKNLKMALPNSNLKKIFIVGETRAQGLWSNPSSPQTPSRSASSPTTQPPLVPSSSLGPNVEFVQGTATSESTLFTGYKDCWGTFINIDGFALGEKAETFWAIRMYELSVQSGIQMFVYRNLDYAYGLSGYDPAFRCGHYDGNGC